jgi:cell shape-determining protein MreC
VNIEKRLSNAYRHRESRFKALFPKRLDKVSSTIRSLKKLSNKTNYVYDQNEIYNGLSLLILEIKDLANAFGLDSSEINSDDNLYTEIREIKEELTSLKIKLKRQEWNKRK